MRAPASNGKGGRSLATTPARRRRPGTRTAASSKIGRLDSLFVLFFH